jgi:hypothetical protein
MLAVYLIVFLLLANCALVPLYSVQSYEQAAVLNAIQRLIKLDK